MAMKHALRPKRTIRPSKPLKAKRVIKPSRPLRAKRKR